MKILNMEQMEKTNGGGILYSNSSGCRAAAIGMGLGIIGAALGPIGVLGMAVAGIGAGVGFAGMMNGCIMYN